MTVSELRRQKAVRKVGRGLEAKIESVGIGDPEHIRQEYQGPKLVKTHPLHPKTLMQPSPNPEV